MTVWSGDLWYWQEVNRRVRYAFCKIVICQLSVRCFTIFFGKIASIDLFWYAVPVMFGADNPSTKPDVMELVRSSSHKSKSIMLALNKESTK